MAVYVEPNVLHTGMESVSSDELKRQQTKGLQPANKVDEEGICRQAEVAATIAAFATNFVRGQKAVAGASGLSTLTQQPRLMSSLPEQLVHARRFSIKAHHLMAPHHCALVVHSFLALVLTMNVMLSHQFLNTFFCSVGVHCQECRISGADDRSWSAAAAQGICRACARAG